MLDSRPPIAQAPLTLEELFRRERRLPESFDLMLGSEQLTVTNVLRLLPGRRVVVQASFHGEPCLAKIFLGRNAARQARREEQGVHAIAEAGVATPTLRWNLSVAGDRVLGFDYLDDATSLLDQWHEDIDNKQRCALLGQVIAILARLHQAGVAQEDIHLDNFLVWQGEIYTIDGGSVSREDAALSRSKSLQNLGWFFAQLYPRYDELIREVLAQYLTCRGWLDDHHFVSDLELMVRKCRESRKRAYLGKTLRECSRFVCHQQFDRFEVCERSAYDADMQALLHDPDEWMAKGTLLKDGNTATVALVALGQRQVTVKRYNIKSPMHALSRAFRPSRAWHSWCHAHLLEFLGIPSLKPLALLEHRWGPLRSRAYFVSEYVAGPDALDQFAELADPDAAEADLQSISAILGSLYSARLSHGDLKATNILMGPGGPVFIDLDAMQEHRREASLRRAFSGDLERFFANWQANPALSTRFADLLAPLCQKLGYAKANG